MNHSIVRWLTVPDIWDFVDKKKPSVENPKEKRTASSFAISIWNEDPDTWEHDYVMSNKLPALHKINLSKANIWAGEEGLVKISFEVTDEDGEDIQFKVLVNNEEIIPLTGFISTPARITESIPIMRFSEKENLLELIVIDELGLETHFSYIIKKENRDTFTFKRVFDFKEDYITDENIEVIYGKGLALKEMGQGEVNIEIPTEGKSTIKNIVVEDNIVQKFTMPIMTSNKQDGITISTSSIYMAGYEGWKAFDGKVDDSSNCWISANGSNHWIKVEFPQKVMLKSFAIIARNDYRTNPPKTFRIEGSNNNFDWKTINQQTNIKKLSPKERVEFEVVSYEAYKYLRLYVTETYPYGSDSYVAIAELEFTFQSELENLAVNNEMTYTQDLGEGKVYESRLLTEYTDIVNIEVI